MVQDALTWSTHPPWGSSGGVAAASHSILVQASTLLGGVMTVAVSAPSSVS